MVLDVDGMQEYWKANSISKASYILAPTTGEWSFGLFVDHLQIMAAREVATVGTRPIFDGDLLSHASDTTGRIGKTERTRLRYFWKHRNETRMTFKPPSYHAFYAAKSSYR